MLSVYGSLHVLDVGCYRLSACETRVWIRKQNSGLFQRHGLHVAISPSCKCLDVRYYCSVADWLVVRPSCSWLNAGVTLRSDFRKKAVVILLIPEEVSVSFVAMAGTINSWNGPTIIFWMAFSSNVSYLFFPWWGLSYSAKSGLWTRVFFRCIDTVYWLKNGIVVTILHIIGKTMNLFWKHFPAKRNGRSSFFRTGNLLPNAVWIFYSGTAVSPRKLRGWQWKCDKTQFQTWRLE